MKLKFGFHSMLLRKSMYIWAQMSQASRAHNSTAIHRQFIRNGVAVSQRVEVAVQTLSVNVVFLIADVEKYICLRVDLKPCLPLLMLLVA